MSTLQSSSRRMAGPEGRSPAVPAAAATAVVFAAEAVVAALAPAELADHATGAGRVSEALAGVGFLLAALTLALAAAGLGRAGRGLAGLAVLGCAAMGVAQVAIAGTGREWPEPVVTAIVLTALIGMAGQAVASVAARAWPVWAAVPVGLIVVVLFAVPSPANSVVIATAFAALALALRRSPGRG